MPLRLPIGTFINMATVTLGSLLGMLLQQNFPPEIKAIVFQAIGLCVLLIGIIMVQKIPAGYLLLLIFSMILGGILGQSIHLHQILQNLGDSLQDFLQIEGSKFSEGLISTFLIFCVGSMTMVGAIEEGLSGNRELLLIKSLLDGFTAIALASTYGIGVLFSIIPMLFFQGGITLLAQSAQRFFTLEMIGMLSSCGGLLILGIGINILEMAKINVENLLPAIFVAALLTWVFQQYKKRQQPKAEQLPSP